MNHPADQRPKFYLTTPIYYANARPHVGSAYTTLVADSYARFKRMQGYDVAFLTGTDEHGENIARAAAKLGITPRELVDKNSAVFRRLWDELGIGYTHFVRTTSIEHERAVRRLLLRARDSGYIYKAHYEGRYCVYDNLYVSDTTEPIDCPVCGRPAEVVSEENYFFKLSAFQERLLKLYEEQPDFLRPAFRRNEILRFVEAGLRDISVSRKTVKWGLPWPEDPEHVVYVWYDALTSYLSGIGYGDDEMQYEKYWPAQLHLIGKEIIRFHCVYWPAFLWAAGEQLPKGVFAHGWLLFDQQKMSKSKGNVAYAEPIARVLGTDALRYYLLRDNPHGFGRAGTAPSLDAHALRHRPPMRPLLLRRMFLPPTCATAAQIGAPAPAKTTAPHTAGSLPCAPPTSPSASCFSASRRAPCAARSPRRRSTARSSSACGSRGCRGFVRQVAVVARFQPIVSPSPLAHKRHIAQQVVAKRIRPLQHAPGSSTRHVALRLAHLLLVKQQPPAARIRPWAIAPRRPTETPASTRSGSG